MTHSRVEHPGQCPLHWLQDLLGEHGESEGVWNTDLAIVEVNFNYVILGRYWGKTGGRGRGEEYGKERWRRGRREGEVEEGKMGRRGRGGGRWEGQVYVEGEAEPEEREEKRRGSGGGRGEERR